MKNEIKIMELIELIKGEKYFHATVHIKKITCGWFKDKTESEIVKVYSPSKSLINPLWYYSDTGNLAKEIGDAINAKIIKKDVLEDKKNILDVYNLFGI